MQEKAKIKKRQKGPGRRKEMKKNTALTTKRVVQ